MTAATLSFLVGVMVGVIATAGALLVMAMAAGDLLDVEERT